MSKLSGHRSISKIAVSEIIRACTSRPLVGNLKKADLPGNAVFRDIIDVMTLGHWSDFAQKHHFMRRSKEHFQ